MTELRISNWECGKLQQQFDIAQPAGWCSLSSAIGTTYPGLIGFTDTNSPVIITLSLQVRTLRTQVLLWKRIGRIWTQYMGVWKRSRQVWKVAEKPPLPNSRAY